MIRNSLSIGRAITVVAATLLMAPVFADDDRDLEGRIESIDTAAGSFVVAGVTIHTDARTDFDDDYTRLEDVKVGDRVEVDFIVRDGRNIATEVEKDD